MQRRRAPRAPSRRAGRPRRPRAAAQRRRSPRRPGRSSTSRRPASARARASSRSARCASRASSRWARSRASSTRASRCRRASARSPASAIATCAAQARCARRVAELLALARGSIFVAHNAAFDVGMLDRALMRLDGTRIGMRVLDTVGPRTPPAGGPHRALRPRERLRALRRDGAPVPPRAARRARDGRGAARADRARAGARRRDGRGRHGARAGRAAARARSAGISRPGLPAGPGVYVMRDRLGQALYVGKAGDLRTRVRSYFGPRRQPPRIEGALAALERIETAPTGSELEAALCELELIRRWRPPGNVRDKRPDRAVYLRLALADHAPALPCARSCATTAPSTRGRSPSRRLATEAAEALRDGYRLRTCRPRVPGRRRPLPARRGRAVPRALPRRRRGARLRALGARAGGLARGRGGRARRAAARARRAPRRAAALRGRRPHHAADRRPARGRRPGRGHPPREPAHAASCSRPTSIPRHVVAFAVVRGALSRSAGCRARASPGSSSARSRASSSARSTRPRRSSRAPRARGCRPSATPRRCCSPRPSPAVRAASCRSRARRPMRWRSSASTARAGGCRCASRCRPGATPAPTSSRPSREPAARAAAVAQSLPGCTRPAR